MRVEDGADRRQGAQAKGSFSEQLQKLRQGAKPPPQHAPAAGAAKLAPSKPTAHPLPAKQGALPLAQKAAVQNQAALSRAKQASAGFAHALEARRNEAEIHRPDRRAVAHKIASLLAEEPPAAEKAPRPAPSEPTSGLQLPAAQAPAATGASSSDASAPPPAPAARTEALAGQIEKLLERCELLAKAEGPALELGLHEGRASRIEVVRTGKGEVALRLDARSGSERRALAAQVGAIREALSSRGLRVRDVRIA